MTAKEKIPPFAWKTIRKQENNFICCNVILLKFINSEVDFAWLIEDKLPCLSVSLFYGTAICLDWLRVLLASGVAPTYAIPLKEFTVSTKVRIYLIYQVMHLTSMYSTQSGYCTILLNLLSLRNYQLGDNISYRRSLQHFPPSHRHL